jgi:hypothetical protein
MLREEEQKLLDLLLLLLLGLTQRIALAAGGDVGTVLGLLALHAVLLLATRLACTRVTAVGTGAVMPLAIATLIKHWRNGGIARAVGNVEVGELGKCRCSGRKIKVAKLLFLFFRHQYLLKAEGRYQRYQTLSERYQTLSDNVDINWDEKLPKNLDSFLLFWILLMDTILDNFISIHKRIH